MVVQNAGSASTQVQFMVQSDDANSSVVVFGGVTELGAWSPEKAVPLKLAPQYA
jgi:hypothetical protein